MTDKIRLKVEVRNNATGELATDIWPDWMYNTYWWEEGNASCDCNRSLFFLRALGRDEADESDCGEGGFSVRLSNADTGEVLYDELEDEVKNPPAV